jgi:DNA-binding protein H-NS
MSFFYQCLINTQEKLQKARKEADSLRNEKEAKEIELKHAKIEIQSQANKIQAYGIHFKSMSEILAYCAHMSKQGIVGSSWPIPIEKPDQMQ